LQVDDYSKDNELPCRISKFWEAVTYAETHNMVPTVVTENEIKDRLNRIEEYYTKRNLKDEDEKFYQEDFRESDYWHIAKKANDINVLIPTLEELTNELNIVPVYDCQTGLEFTLNTEIAIINPLGWSSKSNYENERIPWAEYCERRRLSDCDYRLFSSISVNTSMLSERQIGEKIIVKSGEYVEKHGTVVNSNNCDNVLVKVDGVDEPVNIYAYNLAKLIH
jgi:hypothetical protein